MDAERAPHIRILPHSQKEFPSQDFLQTWLITALKARAGIYRLRSKDAIADLAAGSIALFRYGDYIVGEAIVRGYARQEFTERMLSGDTERYEAYITFVPESVRLFAPPMPIEELQKLVGIEHPLTVARTYFKISDWSIYPKVIAYVAERGRLITC